MAGVAPKPWNGRPRNAGDRHVFGDKLGGAMVGSEAFWNARAKDDAPCDRPAHPPKSDDELFLEAVDAVVGGTDAEAAAACRALPAPAPGETAVASRQIWTPRADDYPPTTRANETAATRLGLSHQRFAPALVVPLAREPKPEFHLLHAGVPELSGLMTVPGNTLLHVAAARGLEDAVAALCERGADTRARNMAGDAPVHVARQRVSTHDRPWVADALRALPHDHGARTRPTWTDAWAAVRDASDENAVALLREVLHLDHRPAAVEDRRGAAYSEEDEKNMREMASLTSRRATLKAAAERERAAEEEELAEERAAAERAAEAAAAEAAGEQSAASRRASERWQDAITIARVAAGGAGARDARDKRAALIARKRLETREWFDYCGATVGFTLAHLAAYKDKPQCLALLLHAGADAFAAAVPAHQKRDEITPLSLAKDLGHARCVAIVDRAADGAPPAQQGAPPPRHPGLADGPYAPPPPPTTRAARLYGGGDVKALLTDAAAESPPPPPPPRPGREAIYGSAAMRGRLGAELPPRRDPTWPEVWDEVRDAPDVLGAEAVRRYAAGLAERPSPDGLHVDSRRLDGYGRDAGRTLAHLAASRGKLRCLAALRDAGADLALGDLDGKTPPQLLAALPKAAEWPALAAELGLDLDADQRVPPRPDPARGQKVWSDCFSALRDASTGEDACLEKALDLADAGGFDARGRGAWHRAAGQDRNLLVMAADRGFRRVVQVLRAVENDPDGNPDEPADQLQKRNTRRPLYRHGAATPSMITTVDRHAGFNRGAAAGFR